MIIISAMSENRVIGSGHGMPWSVPEEYQQYLRFVSGNTVLMGRKTYQIFGEDLPTDTTAVVVSRSAAFDGVTVVPSFEAALEAANTSGNPIFIAGGSSIYEQAIPVASEMYLSTIKGDFSGDAYFPDFNADDWNIAEERNEAAYVFRKYRRRT